MNLIEEMNSVCTASVKFNNAKMYFVGRKNRMWCITEYFDQMHMSKRPQYIEDYIDLAIENKIHVYVVPQNLKAKLYTIFCVNRKLRKNNLLMSMESYIEALFVDETTRENAKQNFPFTDEEVDDIIRKSKWTEIVNNDSFRNEAN